MDNFVVIDQVSFQYRQSQQDPLLAVDHVSMNIPAGSHTAVLGRNGSGKSTLARLINALEMPSEGIVLVQGASTADEQQIWEIRRICGMVFQNPDNQIVGTTVEEDVAFGPENLGFPTEKIRLTVDQALATVGLTEYAQRPPHLLSGGQKQKLAIAGILAMKPACLILDEATAMLDPVSRQEFMDLITQLIKTENMTVINITHHMEEVMLADYVYVMAQGQIVISGTPAEVFDQVDLIKQEGLDVPTHTDIAWQVAKQLEVPLYPLEAASWDDAQRAIRRVLSTRSPKHASETARQQDPVADSTEPVAEAAEPAEIIRVEHLSHTYGLGTNMVSYALQDVSFQVRKGELLGIIGHSGSGKSTLIQHFNGLIRPQQGTVTVAGMDAGQNKDIKKIRQKVGLLFQYPEHQLFEETVFQDIAFGPRRMGLDMNEVERRVVRAAHIVGLRDDEMERSPFELSGGQKRRAAIAGILAMEPEVLVLDEPAAGLDPAGRDEILGYASDLRNMGVTVILVSHSMEDIARLADRVLVLKEGRVHAFGRPENIFTDEVMLNAAGLSLPRTTRFLKTFVADFPAVNLHAYTSEAAADTLIKAAMAREVY